MFATLWGYLMIEFAGAIHFLTLVGLTGAWLEKRIVTWPQWSTPLAFAMLLAATVLYAAAISIGYAGAL